MLTTLMGAATPTLLLLLKATLVLGAAFGLCVALQRASAGTRHLVWLATLGTLLLLPAVARWAPWRLEILPAPAATPATTPATTPAATMPTEPVDAVASRVIEAANGAAIVAPSATASASTPSTGVAARISEWLASLSLGGALLLVWGVVALAIVAWLARGALAVRRIVREAQPLDAPEWRTPLWEVADRLELAEVPRLLVSDEARMPFACGLRQPTVVFPRSCESWSMGRRQVVLLHELAHVKRRDLLGHTIGRVACAFYWFHPLMWTAAKRLRAESERACDDLALACGARASDYAEHLLDIVASVRGENTPAVALAMARRREFEGRMLAILDPRLHRAAPSRRQAAVVVTSVAMLAVLVGAAAPAQRTAEDAPVSMAPVPAAETSRAPNAPRVSGEPRVPARDVATPTQVAIDAPHDPQGRQAAQGRQAPAPEPAPQPDAEEQGEQPAPAAQPDQRNVNVATRDFVGELLGQKRARSDDERARLLANILATDTSASLRRIAAWGLAQHDEDAVAVTALATAVRRDASADVREMAAWALGNTDRPGVVEALTAALKDPSVRVRATAAWALGSVGEEDAVDALAAALGDTSETVRYRAAWAIGAVSPDKAPAQLVALLKDQDAQIRRVVAWSLFVIEDPATADALDQAFRTEKDKNLQLAYVRALAAMGDRSIEPLKKLLESTDPEIRDMAVRALAGGRAGGPWPWPMPMPRPHP